MRFLDALDKSRVHSALSFLKGTCDRNGIGMWAGVRGGGGVGGSRLFDFLLFVPPFSQELQN